MEAHPKTDLDERISPLSCAAFLGRLQVLELLLESPTIDLEFTTQENEYSALQVACMGGHLDCVQFLAENGADVNFMNSIGQTPLIHCFSRITETENMYENSNICLLIAQVLLDNGANINQVSMGRTILMQFCALTMRLDQRNLDINLSAIKFMLEHGADPYMVCQLTNKNCFELAATHCFSEKVSNLLNTTKQIHFHTLAAGRIDLDKVADNSVVNTGCCGSSIFSIFSVCSWK